jgi:phosphatidylglycerol lysyltransferase
MLPRSTNRVAWLDSRFQWLQKLRRIAFLIPVVVFLAACWLLHHELAHYRLHEIRDALWQTPANKILAAAGLTVCSYLILVVCELIAVRSAGARLRLTQIATASLVSYASSYNFGALLGSLMRFRLYPTFGLAADTILNIIIIASATFWTGVASVSAIVFLSQPNDVIRDAWGAVSATPFRWVGIVAAITIILYVGMNIVRRRPVKVFGLSIELPGPRLAVVQVIAGTVDFAVVAGVLWILLPKGVHVSYFGLLSVFAFATVATALSHVPGGWGVFELVVISLALPQKSPEAVGAVVLYRVVYYLIPFCIAATVYLCHEYRLHRASLSGFFQGVMRWSSPVVPTLAALLTFVSGAVLLFSGATPSTPIRIEYLQKLLPLGVLETSHLLGSLVGTILLVLSHGLVRRYDSAWAITSSLLVFGIAASLLKGLDWEEATLLAFVLLVLIAGRRQFYRRGSLLHSPLSWSWLAAIFMAVVAAIWLGVFAHKHVEYSNDLWWQVAYRADASRFLRASLVSMVTLLLAAMMSLFRGKRPKRVSPTMDELTTARNIIDGQPSADAWLAIVGDKSLLFNEARSGFVMYATSGRSWIALGDPIGSDAVSASLVWDFHELADAHGGLTAFYQVPAASLPMYLQLGLSPIKIGDSARVPLEGFCYEGPKYKHLRQVRHRYERAGFIFDVIAAQDVPAVLPRLREISDQWLAEKHAAEKRFSIGFFSESYLSQTPIAVVKREDEIVAFANVLATEVKDELSVDLMRHVSGVPNGIMDYLFGQLMQSGKEHSFRHFDLGMAPLSGLESRRLAPIWNRIGNTIFRHGEHFYNFEGLRHYKEKFHPCWEPHYLMYPGGLVLSRVLLDLATLISGGLKRAITS